jgi:transmembrane sensor
MKQGDEWKWMISKLSGNSNPEEESLLTSWINASRQNKVLYDEVSKIWEASSSKLKLSNPNTEQELKRLQERITVHQSKKGISQFQTWLAIAAILIISFGFYYLFVDTSSTTIGKENTHIPIVEHKSDIKKEEPVAEQKEDDKHISIASSTKVKTIILPDSSRVWLNVNSRISYLPSFLKERTISLTGEAYFIVRHDLKHPFSVQTGKVVTSVLGTSFNVKEQGNTVSVTVAHGKVRMTHDTDSKEIVLTTSEKGTYKDGKLSKSINDNTLFAAWREKNNPSFEKERKLPGNYLINLYAWKKDHFNRSMLEGVLSNTASLATYHNIVLKVTYAKHHNKKTVTLRIPIEEPLRPGQRINYYKKLMDILTPEHSFQVEIEKADIVPNQYF